ncbi:hypothetical protein niasHT_015233 [Heterodera trifolii]|uniref:Uncharacterized protein n=1 Tax=Heterodera trifolii TaxID=157864 RepID=A0ABD2L2E3_9BILA
MRAVFNFTFVKWAAEFAHFRVIKDYGGTAEEAYPNYKFHHIGDWQLKTLLSAYKIVSAENDNDENG